jgi:hypothetical protein
MRKIFLVKFFLLIMVISGTAQTAAIDSLNIVLQKAQHDSTRSVIYANLSRQLAFIRPDSALKLAQKGLLLARKVNYTYGETFNLARMGACYDVMGNSARAMDLLLQSLKKAESIGHVSSQLRALDGLASVHASQGDYDKALFYDLKILSIGENVSTRGPADRSATLANIGDDYEKLNKLDSARYYTNLSYDIASQLNAQEQKALALNNLGNIHYKMNQPEVSAANYRLSLSYHNRISNTRIFCESSMGMANIFLTNGEDDSALAYAKRAFVAAENAEYAQQLVDAGNFLADYYRKQRLVDSAYKYLTAVIAQKDSLYSRERTNQIKNLSFDENIRQQEIATNTAQLEQERIMNIQYGIIAVTVVSFIILFFLLSQSIIINEKWVRFLGVLALLLVFEFINLFIHPWLSEVTNHSPFYMLLVMVVIASLIIPLHHRLEHWIVNRMVRKNKRLRLESARRTVAKLEAEEKV